ncbi:MAG TPA: hypothetical protein VGV15_01570 [Terriglobales bacterium]|nr:hypothetical protein [Terriglobales bacterium]
MRVVTKPEFHGSGVGPVGFAGAAGACGAAALGGPLGGGVGALVSSGMVAGEQTSGGARYYKER